MTFEDFEAMIARIEIRNPPFTINVFARRMGDPNRAMLVIRTVVPDRDTGAEKVVMHEHEVFVYSSFESLVARVRGALHKVAEHEMDEALHVDGKRRFDPHVARATKRSE